MKKLSILLLTLFLVSCTRGGNVDSSKDQGTIDTNGSVGIREGQDYMKALGDVSPKIKDSSEFNACITSQVSLCAQSATMQIARKDKSGDFCNELESPDQRESCKFALIMTDIQETGDEKLCDTLTGKFKNTCINGAYRAQAMKTKDIKLCNQVVVTEIQNGGPNERMQCIMSVIMANSSSTVADCKQIGNASLENMCSVSLRERGTLSPPPVPSTSTGTPLEKDVGTGETVGEL